MKSEKPRKPIAPPHKMGNVDEGTTVTDWMDDERKRGISITAACVSCTWWMKEDTAWLTEGK